HALVVVDRRLPARSVGGGKQPAPAIAGDRQVVRANDARGLIEPRRLDMVAPRRDRRNAVLEAGLDAILEAELLAHRCEIDREAVGFHHHAQSVAACGTGWGRGLSCIAEKSGIGPTPKPGVSSEPSAICPSRMVTRTLSPARW